jgi:NAD(P)-dependent dehydrogenase (short-subunit alcohol dehydrogenase family)
MRFENTSAIVTGAGSGIGRAVARRLAAEGARVAVVDINRETAEETRAMVADAGGAAVALPADVSSPAAVRDAVAGATDWGGVPDVLVNNAGILRLAPALDTSVAVFDEVIAVNLRSVFLMSTEVARAMVAAGTRGRIVNISSIHAALSEPNACAYTAAKAGIEGLSRTLASELAPAGITVNCVRPGATWTALSTPLYTDTVIKQLHQRIPLRDIAQPDEIAAAVAYLASAEARYCTGTTLAVDGGYLMDGGLPGGAYDEATE